MIYFDNAATSMRKPQEVIDAINYAVSNLGNAKRGINEAGRVLYATRKKLAKFFNVDDENQIAFTYNSTESLNIAIKSLLSDLKEGENVVTTTLEHNSVLRPLYEYEDKLEIRIVKADENGNLIYEEFDKLVDEKTKFVVLTHASNLTGNIVDVEKVAKICKEKDKILILDASQTAGHINIDVKKMNIDILCFTAHKSLLALQGVGGIYVNPKIKLKGLKSGGTGTDTYSKKHTDKMPHSLEAGTLNMHGIYTLSASLDYINSYGMDKIREKEVDLMKLFYSLIKDIEGVKVYGDFSTFNRCPIVALNYKDVDSEILGEDLQNNFDILIRTGAHCAPLMHRHFKTENQGMLRFSFSHFNEKEEVLEVVEVLKTIFKDYA